MVIDKICLKRRLEVDASKFCICNKICLTLSSNVCVSSSSLLILKRVDVRACTSDCQFHYLYHDKTLQDNNDKQDMYLSYQLLLTVAFLHHLYHTSHLLLLYILFQDAQRSYPFLWHAVQQMFFVMCWLFVVLCKQNRKIESYYKSP